MNTLRIDLLNPKVNGILKELAYLHLIAISDSSKNGLADVLKRLRAHSKAAPSLEEVTEEVQIVRAKRYAR